MLLFLLPQGRGKVDEMKRILLILIIITVSVSLFAEDLKSSTMIVKVNPNPTGFITAKLRDADGGVYDSSKNVPLHISSDVDGVASVYLDYYIIGQGTISITIDSQLKNSKDTGENVDNLIDYSIALSTTDTDGITFNPTSISSNGKKTSTGSTTDDKSQLKVRTKGTYLLSFKTSEDLMSKNYGTYTSSVTVQFQTK